MNTISVLKLMPETKAQQENFANQVLQSVLTGNVNPVDLDIMLKSIEETISKIRKNAEFKDYLSDELDKYHEKTIDFVNCEITKAGRTTMEFKEDHVWSDLKRKLKAREDLIKLSRTSPVVDAETGEQVFPVTTKSSEYLRYKFK